MIEQVVVNGAVMTKGVLGILISLHLEDYMTADMATYWYNMIAVSVLLFIAAMSGPRSEAAFCIVIPIFAGIFELFGWLTVTDPTTHLQSVTGTYGLFVITVVMGILGVTLYMNDQNKQNYGTAGPGAKWLNVAFFLMFFNVALTIVSGFSVFPMGASQPVPGTCAVGFTCDAYNNIDFTSSFNSISNMGGLQASAVSLITLLPIVIITSLLFILNVAIGMAAFPLVINNIISGIFPGIATNPVYLVMLGGLEVVVLAIYAMGIYETLYKPSPGTGTL